MPRTDYGLPGIYNSVALTLSSGTGSALAVDSSGRLIVSPVSGGSSVNIADIAGDAVVTAGIAGLLAVGGNTASGVTDTGNPVKVGGKYNLTPITLTDGQRGDLQLDSQGRLKNTQAPLASSTDSVTAVPSTSSTPTETNVSGSVSSVTVLAANVNRKNASVFNDSTAVLYLLWGSGTASVTNYTVQLASGQYYELPYIPIFTGQLTGIWASATGTARVTEAV